MKFADWFRGVAGVVLADVNGVFDKAKAFVAASPLPANLKADVTALISDAQSDLTSLESLIGTEVGQVVADAVDDVTTLLLNTSNAVSNSKSIADLSAAERAALQQTWKAMVAQGNTLMAQFMAGIDPTKPAAADHQSS